jgi:hypothetical protein
MSGAIDASVTLDEVLAVVGAKRVPLAPELAGYLVLEIAEHADPIGGNVDPKSVFVGEEGTVALVKPKRDRANGDAEASIREFLGRLLDASGSQTPALAAASKRKNGAGLPALTEELDAALIPVNRAAGRRALARLAREVKRVTLGVGRHTLPSSSPPPSPRRAPASASSTEEDSTIARAAKASSKRATPAIASELPTMELVPERDAPSHSDADLDSLIAQFGVSGGTENSRALRAIAGLDPTPAPPTQGAKPSEPSDSDVEELLGMGSEPAAGEAPAARPATGRAPARRPGPERQLPTQPSHLRKTRATSASELHLAQRGGWWSLAVLAFVAVAAGSYAVWWLRPDAIVRHPSPPTESTAPPPSLEMAPACVGTLVVTDVPPRAEVLLHEGQAPIEIPRMPVGARLEFVATAEGYAPKRVVVPAGASWDPGPDGKLRFEAAVQLDSSHARGGSGDPWPAGEPGSAVGGEGPPGAVRVVATPRGAEVWMLAGIAPEARIEHLRCDQDMEVLLAGPTTYRKRIRIGASDFLPSEPSASNAVAGKARVARISGK